MHPSGYTKDHLKIKKSKNPKRLTETTINPRIKTKMNQTNYTFTIVVDKNLPGQIYTALISLIVWVVGILTPYFIATVQYSRLVRIEFVQYFSPLIKEGYETGYEYFNLVYSFVYSFVYTNFYEIISAVATFYTVLAVGRCLYVRRLRAKQFDELITKLEKINQRDHEKIVSMLMAPYQKTEKIEEETETDEKRDYYDPSDSDISVYESGPDYSEPERTYDDPSDSEYSDDESDDEKNDPTYNPSDSDSDTDSESSDTDSESSNEFRICSHVIVHHHRCPSLPIRKGRPVRKVQNGRYILNPRTGRYVLKQTPAPKINAYVWFCKQNRTLFAQKNPELNYTQLISVMTQVWKKMSVAQRTKYLALERKDNARYEKELEEYN